MQLSHFYHRHRLHRLAGHKDLGLFELAIWLHTLAESLVWVFVPILLVKTGYSIQSVLIYFLIFNVIDVPLNFFVDGLIRKIGARKTMIMGTFAIISFFVLIGILTPGNMPLLIVLAFLGAIYDTFFWVSHIYIFTEINRSGLDAGSSVGATEGVRKLAGIVGPALGAFLLIVSGKIALVVVAIATFSLSMAPLFKMKHVRDVPDEKKATLRGFFSDRREQSNYLSTALSGIHYEVDGNLWPLFIFATFGTLESVAALPIIVSLTTAAFSYFAGKLSKRYAPGMMMLGSVLIALTWIARALFQNGVLYFVTVFFIGFFTLLLSIPLDGNIVERGLEKGSLAASTYRNVASMILRIPLYLILLVLLEVFKASFMITAVCLFIVFLTTLLFVRQKRILSPIT